LPLPNISICIESNVYGGVLDWIKLTQFPFNKDLVNKSGGTPAVPPNIAIEVDSVASLCRKGAGRDGRRSDPRFLLDDRFWHRTDLVDHVRYVCSRG